MDKKYPRKIDDAVFVVMIAGGKTPKQIAIDMGVSKQAVSLRAMKLGVIEALRENKGQKEPKPPKAPKPPKENPYGISAELYRNLVDRGAVRAFKTQQRHAKTRGIGWELTLAQWWALWEDSYDRRGSRKGCLVMCRTGDVGPYAVGNVRIATGKENAQECALETLTKRGRRMPSRQFVPFPPGAIPSRHGVFREYREEDETA